RCGAAAGPSLLLVLGWWAMFPRVAEATVTRQESANVSVMGVVTDREYGEPVRNAVVILAPVADDTDESVGPSYTLGVDDEGRFRSPSLEAGRYLVGIRAPGYHPLDERVTVRGGRRGRRSGLRRGHPDHRGKPPLVVRR